MIWIIWICLIAFAFRCMYWMAGVDEDMREIYRKELNKTGVKL